MTQEWIFWPVPIAYFAVLSFIFWSSFFIDDVPLLNVICLWYILGALSLQKYYLTSMWIRVIKLWWCHGHLIFIMGMPIPGKMVFILKQGSASFWPHIPDSKVHGTNMGPIWVLSAPDLPHVDPINLAIRDIAQIATEQPSHNAVFF